MGRPKEQNTAVEEKKDFWERIEGCPLWRLVAFIFLFCLSERVVVTLVFFLRWGWHTVSGIELWFYYGVAKGTFDLYSVWDPTLWILRALGALLGGMPLLYGTYLVASLSSSLNAALFCLFVSEVHGKKTGFLAGILYGSMVLPMFNSAGTVTHDIFAYPYLVLSIYGAAAAVRRKGWRKLPYAGLSVLALFLGRQVGPTIYVGAGTIGIYLLWQAVAALLGDRRRPRNLALILTPLLAMTAVYFGGRFIFGEVGTKTLLITLGATAVFFGVWEAVRLGLRGGRVVLLLSLLAASLFLFGWILIRYRVLGDALSVEGVWGWVFAVVFAALVTGLLYFYSRSEKDLSHLPVAIFLVLLFTLIVLLHFEVTPSMMEKTYDLALKERGIDVRAQIKAGSGDLLGSSLGDYWLRFNFLLFFLPVGLWIAFRKNDVLGWALILSGFLMSLAADRGTRPLTFGFALMGALAFVNWRAVYGGVLALWMCFIIGVFGDKYSTEYAVFFPAAALFIYYSIQWPADDRRSTTGLLTLLVSLGALLAGFILLSSSSLRDSLGFFSIPDIPGGLLRAAPGFRYLFVFLAAAAAGLLVCLIRKWAVRSVRPRWIWAILSLTVLWIVAGGMLGGAVFQAKQQGRPEELRLLEEIGRLEPTRQIEAINSILAALNRFIEAVRRHWSIQICLLVPGLLMLLFALSLPVPDRKSRRWMLGALEKTAFGAIPLLGLLLLFLGLEKFWTALYLIAPPLFGGLLFILLWPQRGRKFGHYPAGVAAVCWLFATIIPSMNQTAKSAEGEYRSYQWLNEHAGGKGKIFVPWSDGYMAEAISGLPSELSPEKIDFELPRLYWLPEPEAARALHSRGLEYILVSSKYFKLLRYNKQTGEFQYSFSPDIIYQPQQLGVSNVTQLQETTLYRLLYRPRGLSHFELLHHERDAAVNETFFIYRVIP
ncbi:MAG: hypothetical protein V1789_11200 [PVC group bacterium]